MQLKLLTDTIQHIAGKSAQGISAVLYGKKDINEFLIAKKINLTINQTRNILYKLLEAGIVSFTRKKDKKKAWYTYFWTLDTAKSLEVLEAIMQKELDGYKKQLALRETKRFYVCKNCSIEVNEETALLNDFTCQECGSVYELNEDKKIIQDIQTGIAKIERNISVVKEEVKKAQSEDAKKDARKRARGKKKKDAEKKVKAAERKAARAAKK